MKILRLGMVDTREGWVYRVTFSHEGGMPTAPAQRKAMAECLEARAKEIREHKPASIGQADNFQQKPLIRRSDWIIDRED